MIKKGDKISILSGNYKGLKGVISKVFPKKKKVIVFGINMIKKHIKPNAKNPKGGIIKKEAPIHISNLKKEAPIHISNLKKEAPIHISNLKKEEKKKIDDSLSV
ncbi:50S ribosomal protein L24 [Blattabacterium punctulatus]|uniref:50S ribosomal protein L24 n=1 Tax=Blattabacterium punctulatus TaxID=164514 RepID=UPI000D7C4BFA|nr:50S ribosomal protein L24 [Blattabacterium punctulatus]AWU40344.1 50S ribosomal protein L24 [Blattabacterium punctulatus]